ncbi:MAG: CbtB-domain containing protein [Candidatus Tectomicrobia bacterium]|nr:CbtB-domain containing protein [Candidatus Tectomicrobia bacterium]
MQRDNSHPMTRRQQFRFIRRQFYVFRRHNITIVKQALAMIAVTTFVLYSILFTNIPTLHHFFHELRHALGIIPCH